MRAFGEYVHRNLFWLAQLLLQRKCSEVCIWLWNIWAISSFSALFLVKEDCIHCSVVMDMPTGIFSPPLLYFLWYILLWFLFLRPLTERGNFLSFSFSKLYLGNKARWPIYYALYGSRNYYHMRIYSVFYTILSYTWIMCFESSCKSFLVGFLASQWMS